MGAESRKAEQGNKSDLSWLPGGRARDRERHTQRDRDREEDRIREKKIKIIALTDFPKSDSTLIVGGINLYNFNGE